MAVIYSNIVALNTRLFTRYVRRHPSKKINNKSYLKSFSHASESHKTSANLSVRDYFRQFSDWWETYFGHSQESPGSASSYEKSRCFDVQVYIGQTGNKGILLRFLPTCYCKTSFFVTGHPCSEQKSLTPLMFVSVASCVWIFILLQCIIDDYAEDGGPGEV